MILPHFSLSSDFPILQSEHEIVLYDVNYSNCGHTVGTSTQAVKTIIYQHYCHAKQQQINWMVTQNKCLF